MPEAPEDISHYDVTYVSMVDMQGLVSMVDMQGLFHSHYIHSCHLSGYETKTHSASSTIFTER